MVRFLAVLISILLFLPQTWAAQILDQSNIASSKSGDPVRLAIANDIVISQLNISIDNAGMQFVTAGMAGKLSQVDIQLSQLQLPFGPVPIGAGRMIIGKDITFNPDNTVSSATILGEIAFSANAINTAGNFTSFDTSALNIFLNSGEQFAIAVLPSQQQTTLFFWEAGDDTYSAGAGYGGFRLAEPDGDDYAWGISSSLPARDYGFQTWMAAVPEPESWAMMIIGFAMAGAAMRRRGISPALT